LADDRDLDLAGILHRLLDLLGDVLAQADRRQVVDVLRLDDDTHLAACLQGVALVHALEGVGDLLQRAHTLEVALQALAACAGPRPADRICRLDDDGLDALLLDLVVVRLDAVHDGSRHAVAAAELRADLRVRALDLVVHRLADVVQQTAHLGDLDVGAKLGGKHARQPRCLDGMGKLLLPVAGAELEPPQHLDHLAVQAAHARVVCRTLALFLDDLLHLLLGGFDQLLDAGGMDAPVEDEPVHGALGDLTPHRVEAADGHGFRRVVYDHVHATRLLKGADVPPVAPDDAALHLVVGQGHHRNGDIRHIVRRDALDSQRDQFTGALVRFGVEFVLDLADAARHIVSRLFFHKGQQVLAGLLTRHLGDALQGLHALGLQFFKLVALAVERALPLVEALLALFELLKPLVELLAALLQAIFLTIQVGATTSQLLFHLFALPGDLVAPLSQYVLCLMPRHDDDVLGFLLRCDAFVVFNPREPRIRGSSAQGQAGDGSDQD